jgi:hypothetical protein
LGPRLPDRFGQAWRELDKEALTAIIAAASGMTHSALINSGRDPRNFFLRHEVGISSLAGHGVNETIIAWFEELRRIAGGITRFYKGHHTPQEVQSEFDERLQALESSCSCSSCGDGSALFCKVTLPLVVVGLGLYVARMVVVPNLYLKVGGIQMFYHQLHEDRLKRQETHVGYSEWFIKDITTDLPTPLKMLEVASVLFTGTRPGHMPENCVSLNRDGLFFMITYLKFDPNAAAESRPDASVQVHNGGFSYNGRFLSGNSWNNGIANISLLEGFNNIRTKPKEVRQIVKLHDQTTLISQIPRSPEWEAKAEEQGWDVMG